MNTFEIQDALQFGWGKTKEHFTYLLGLVLIIFVSAIVLNALSGIPILGFLLTIAGQTILNMGMIKISLALGRNNKKASYKELFTTYQPFWVFLGASLLMGLAVAVGMVLLVIPGIIAAIMLQFSTYLVIDKGLGVMESLKESVNMTKGNRWKLFGLMLILALMNAVGGLLFGIGLLVTVPITLMAMVHVYDKLVGAPSSVPAQPIAPKPPISTPLDKPTVPGVA